MSPKHGRGHPVQRVVGPFFVILPHPLRTDFAHLIQRLEHVGVTHFVTKGAIEPFHKGILIGLAWLDVAQGNAAVRTPPGKPVRQKLWPIVEPNRLRLASPGGDVLQDSNHPFGRQRGIDFDRQDFAHPFIQQVERSEPPPAVQRITHEIYGPHGVGLGHDDEGLADPDRESLLGPSGHIQSKLAVHAPQPFMVPPMPRVPKPMHVFPEPPAGLRGAERGERLNHRRIPLGPIDYRTIIRGSPKPLSSATYYMWKAQYGGLEASDIKRLKDLEHENGRLKRMYADLSLENAALKDVIAKKL